MAPPAGFNSTMQHSKRQLNKITVLGEFVIHGGLRTQSVYRNSYLTIATFIETSVCACVHTRWFFLPRRSLTGAPLFRSPLPCNTQDSKSTGQAMNKSKNPFIVQYPKQIRRALEFFIIGNKVAPNT